MKSILPIGGVCLWMSVYVSDCSFGKRDVLAEISMNNSVISGQGVGFLIPITVFPLTQAQGSKQHSVHLP